MVFQIRKNAIFVLQASRKERSKLLQQEKIMVIR